MRPPLLSRVEWPFGAPGLSRLRASLMALGMGVGTLLIGSSTVQAQSALEYQQVVTVGNYVGVRESLDDRANALIGAYVSGLSDGIYAQEMAVRRARGGEANLCFEGDNRRPTRQEALSVLDGFVARLFVGKTEPQDVQAVEDFPLLTVMQVAYQDAYACASRP